jgi:hypothetical protein
LNEATGATTDAEAPPRSPSERDVVGTLATSAMRVYVGTQEHSSEIDTAPLGETTFDICVLQR